MVGLVSHKAQFWRRHHDVGICDCFWWKTFGKVFLNIFMVWIRVDVTIRTYIFKFAILNEPFVPNSWARLCGFLLDDSIPNHHQSLLSLSNHVMFCRLSLCPLNLPPSLSTFHVYQITPPFQFVLYCIHSYRYIFMHLYTRHVLVYLYRQIWGYKHPRLASLYNPLVKCAVVGSSLVLR